MYLHDTPTDSLFGRLRQLRASSTAAGAATSGNAAKPQDDNTKNKK